MLWVVALLGAEGGEEEAQVRLVASEHASPPKEMGYALEAESDELIEEKDVREGLQMGRWIVPQIESFADSGGADETRVDGSGVGHEVGNGVGRHDFV